jgi:hypothetical protein
MRGIGEAGAVRRFRDRTPRMKRCDGASNAKQSQVRPQRNANRFGKRMHEARGRQARDAREMRERSHGRIEIVLIEVSKHLFDAWVHSA